MGHTLSTSPRRIAVAFLLAFIGSMTFCFAQNSCDEIEETLTTMRELTNEGAFDESLQLSESLVPPKDDCEAWALVVLEVGMIHFQTEQFEQAFRDYEKALSLAKGRAGLLIRINMYMSALHRRSGAPDKALQHIKRGMKLAAKNEIDSFNAELFNSYANILGHTDRDSAIFYYKLAYEAFGEECLSCRSTVLNNIGSGYAYERNFKEAVTYFSRAYALDSAANDSVRLMRTLFNLGRIEYMKGDFTEAEVHFKKSMVLAKRFGWNMSIPFMTNMIGGIRAAEGDVDAAYDQFMQAASIDDSLFGANSAEAVSNAVASYEVQEAELKNELLLKENELITQDKNFRTISLLVVLAVVVFLAFILVFIIRQRQELRMLNTSLDTHNERLKELIKEKDGFMGMLTHDLRTPVSNVSSLLYLLEDPGLAEEEREDLLKDAQGSSQQGLHLINDLIALYKAEANEEEEVSLESVDLGAYLSEVVKYYNVMCLAKGQDLSIYLRSGMLILSNKAILRSIVGNLLSNAIKFTPLGGSISISAYKDGDAITIKVEDSGPGFTEEDRTKLFGKFQRLSARPTAEENSSGLGLHLVHLMVKKLKGEIDLVSKEGAGSTFLVTLYQ